MSWRQGFQVWAQGFVVSCGGQGLKALDAPTEEHLNVRGLRRAQRG